MVQKESGRQLLITAFRQLLIRSTAFLEEIKRRLKIHLPKTGTDNFTYTSRIIAKSYLDNVREEEPY